MLVVDPFVALFALAVVLVKAASVVLLWAFIVTGIDEGPMRPLELIATRARSFVARFARSFFARLGLAVIVIVAAVASSGCTASTRPACATARQAGETVCELARSSADAYCRHTGDPGGQR